MSASIPALPHRWRLWAIVIVTLLELAALAALHLGVGAERVGELQPLVETALYAMLALLAPALADAYLVERRRRTPGIPALPDDHAVETDPVIGTRRPSRPYDAGLVLVLVILAASLSVATSGCSTGPQTVPQATPINISCTWHENACPRVLDGGIAPHAENGSTASDEQPGSATGSITVGGCDCYVDRATSGAEATTQGNVIRDNTVNPQVEANVSGAQTQ